MPRTAGADIHFRVWLIAVRASPSGCIAERWGSPASRLQTLCFVQNLFRKTAPGIQYLDPNERSVAVEIKDDLASSNLVTNRNLVACLACSDRLQRDVSRINLGIVGDTHLAHLAALAAVGLPRGSFASLAQPRPP